MRCWDKWEKGRERRRMRCDDKWEKGRGRRKMRCDELEKGRERRGKGKDKRKSPLISC